MGAYVFDNAWDRERERLAGLETLLDPGTQKVAESLGIAQGWRCLEVGGGGGSMARWFAERVGPTGRVVATDLDTRFLDAIPVPNLDVLRHDVLRDDLPQDHFDLAHARLLVEHLPDRELALKRMIAALKPGGWLIVEDCDWGAWLARPPQVYVVPSSLTRSAVKVWRAALRFMESAGYDPTYGRRLPGELVAHGLVEVGAEGRSRFSRGGAPESTAPRWTLLELRDRLVEAGLAKRSEVDRAIAIFEDPDSGGFGPVIVAAWGRRPGHGGALRSEETALARRREELADRLEVLPLFAGLAHDQGDRIAALAHEVAVEGGHVLTQEGTPGASFFVIESGTANVSHEGRTLASLGPGSYFGEIALVERGPRTATVTAATPMRLLAFEVHAFSALMRDLPSVSEKITRSIEERKRSLAEDSSG
jgi:SAM-dependent methyltransferase